MEGRPWASQPDRHGARGCGQPRADFGATAYAAAHDSRAKRTRPIDRTAGAGRSCQFGQRLGQRPPGGCDVEPRDRYDRLLAYVWLPDGTFWNALLAAEGYAQLITVPPNVTYVELFRHLVAEARSAQRGLWVGEAR